MQPAHDIPDASLRMLLPTARLRKAATAFARHRIARIEPAFPAEVAEALHYHLAHEVEWQRAANQGDNVVNVRPGAPAVATKEGRNALLAFVHAGARKGFQFFYDTLRISEDAATRLQRGLLVDRLVEGLNQPESLATFRTITGNDSVRLVDCQATRYLPGDFLTGHNDLADGRNRIAAWVLNLAPQWQIEWGGLLQFHNEYGDVSHAITPRFNGLVMFSVPQVHSVSVVAPFAPTPRYALSGWVRG